MSISSYTHQYLEVCQRHNVALEKDLAVGKTLAVSRQYFEIAHECIFEVGLKLAQVLWRKLKPDELELADGNLLSVGFEVLEEGRYRLARCLLDFSTETLKKHGKEEHRLAMIVNRAQAYKWSGDEITARKIVSDIDWTAKALKFQLAEAVLLDKFDRAIEIMKRIGPAEDDVSKMGYREWPLFKEIRQVGEFAAAFAQIFGEPLNTVILQPHAPSSGSGPTIH
jgi:hypothetical protein